MIKWNCKRQYGDPCIIISNVDEKQLSNFRNKSMNDAKIVYLIACGILSRECITNAIDDDAKLKKLIV